MPRKALRILKTMPAKRHQHRVFFGKRNQTIANVAHRRHIEGSPQNAGRAAAIGDSNNCGQIEGSLLAADFRQTRQQYRQAGPPTDADYPHLPRLVMYRPLVDGADLLPLGMSILAFDLVSPALLAA